MANVPTVDFPAGDFRDGIHLAMQMGQATDAAQRVTFLFPTGGRTYWRDGVQLADAPRTDQEGRPLDPFIEMREVPASEPLQVLCAVEFVERPQNETPVGNFQPTRLTITLLDTEWALVKDSREVIVGGDRYRVIYHPPDLAMFTVGVHQMVCYAVDES